MENLAIHDDAAEPSAAADDISSNQGADAAKKARNLQKKLKQIQQLKDKLSSSGMNALTPEQVQKLDCEQSLLSELQQLEQYT